MYPWGHLIVGYLCYTLAVRLRYRRPPTGSAVLALAVGTQLPDLIDKPLAWSLEILPSGRSLGHSLLFVAGVAVVAVYGARRANRRVEAGAFVTGHLTHVAADLLPGVLSGNWPSLGAALWPLTPAYQYPGETDRRIVEYLSSIDIESVPTESIALLVFTMMVWVFDGMPGVKTVFVRLHRSTRSENR